MGPPTRGVSSSPAGRDVERFAVIIGNDHGAPGEATLRYAESDATKIANVLQELGGFAPENVTILCGRDVSTVLRAIIAVDDRIR
jgi:hypothetical protein